MTEPDLDQVIAADRVEPPFTFPRCSFVPDSGVCPCGAHDGDGLGIEAGADIPSVIDGEVIADVVEPASANAPATHVLVCTRPTCPQRKQQVQVHADTVLPVHCGGCAGVLHCDHTLETSTVRVGTLGAPEEHTVTACTVCKTETQRDVKTLPPVNLLELPVGVLDLPL